MSFLDCSHSIAPHDYNRWLVPPAALAVHLSIGQIYAYSVFNAPLTKLIGITQSAPDDWKLTTVGWVFSIALAVWWRWLLVSVPLAYGMIMMFIKVFDLF